MMHLIVLLSLLSTSAVVLADHSTVPDHDLDNLICDLECKNNGVCRYHSKHRHELQKRMQSGRMVQQCLCPLGYHGMSCDVNVEVKTTDECAAATKLSVFAGEQCRKPFTEYCASLGNSVGGHISFCTNGGKCRADWLAARLSPGNTTNNYVFQHAGCVCPPEFKGDHCELLNKNYRPPPRHHHAMSSQSTTSSSKKDKRTVFSFLVVSIGALAVMALVLIRKLRRKRRNIALHRLPKPSFALPGIYTDEPAEDDDDEEYHSGGEGSCYSSEDDDESAILPKLA